MKTNIILLVSATGFFHIGKLSKDISKDINVKPFLERNYFKTEMIVKCNIYYIIFF